jgi:hypothetical protein
VGTSVSVSASTLNAGIERDRAGTEEGPHAKAPRRKVLGLVEQISVVSSALFWGARTHAQNPVLFSTLLTFAP